MNISNNKYINICLHKKLIAKEIKFYLHSGNLTSIHLPLHCPVITIPLSVKLTAIKVIQDRIDQSLNDLNFLCPTTPNKPTVDT